MRACVAQSDRRSDARLSFFETAGRAGRRGERSARRHGKPVGVLIGFESEDWFEYRLEHDPRFLRRIEQARNSLRAGRGTRLEDIETE